MMSTTDHLLARNAEQTLQEVVTDLARYWSKDHGIPESVASVTRQDALTRIVVERALTEAGIDVWWNDLLCRSAGQASAAVLKVAEQGVDLELLYGKNWEPIVGILKAAVLMSPGDIGNMSGQLPGDAFNRLYALAFEQARAFDVDRMMQRILSDVLFACHRDDSVSPATHVRFLHGARVLELAAAWYVLDGVEASPSVELLEPIKRALFPHLPNLNGGIA